MSMKNRITGPLLSLRMFRLEEFIGLWFTIFVVLGSGFFTLKSLVNPGPESPHIIFSTLRILLSIGFIIGFYKLTIQRASNDQFRWIRDFAPFLFVLAIFMNLHNTIALINQHDFHHTLAGLDASIFGVQPSQWVEQFYHPRLTDWFALAYVNYYLITPVLLFLLYRQNSHAEFREIMLTMMISYYIGFVGYIIFPAASPYIVMPEIYQVDIWKDTSLVSRLVRFIVGLSPDRVRDAFPSMHNGITFLTMIFAWRFHRKFFWIQLPLAISLVVATIYLRYHFVVDILAGVIVVALSFYLTPRLVNYWERSVNKDQKQMSMENI